MLKFKGKVLALILVPTILIVGLIQFTAYYILSDMFLQGAEMSMTEKVENGKKLIEQQIEAEKSLLRILAENEMTLRALTVGEESGVETLEETMSHIVSENSQLESVVLLNNKGISVATAIGNRGRDISGNDFFKEAVKGEMYTSEAFVSKVSGNTIFAVSAPVIVDGEVAGVIAFINKIDHIAEGIVNPIKIGETGYALLTDSTGVCLVHPNQELILNKEAVSKSDSINITTMKKGINYYE